jgi:poly(A) polymerase
MPKRPLPPGIQTNDPYDTSAFIRDAAVENASSQRLLAYLDVVAPLDGEEGQRKREIVLQTLVGLFREWLNEVAEAKGVIDEDANEQVAPGKTQQLVRGRIFCSGSYRLGINSPDGDIDTVCVVPPYVERSDFFTTFVAKLRSCVDVDSANPIEDAGVPIIELVISGVDIDIGIARAFSFMPVLPKVGETDEKYSGTILDDRVLCGGDMKDMKDMFAMNGPRVTELIELIMQDSFETFKIVVRALRLWAKRRGIYSNKMGYLGGVNFNILGAFICQLYPNLSAGALLHRFFEIFGRQWAWRNPHNLPQPVSLLKKVSGATDIGYDAQVWDGNDPRCLDIRRKHAVMPILTPAYPSSDSAYNVSFSTLRAMLRELHKGAEITSAIMAEPDPSRHDWTLLFSPSDFFCLFDTYLVLELRADNDDDLDAFTKWVDSRIRLLIKDLEDPKYGLSVNMLTANGHVRPWPKPEPKVDYEDKVVPDDYQIETNEDSLSKEKDKLVAAVANLDDAAIEATESKTTTIITTTITPLLPATTTQGALSATSLIQSSDSVFVDTPPQILHRERSSEMMEEAELQNTESDAQEPANATSALLQQEVDVEVENNAKVMDLTTDASNPVATSEFQGDASGVPAVINAERVESVSDLTSTVKLENEPVIGIDSAPSSDLPDVAATSAVPPADEDSAPPPPPTLLKRTIKVAVNKNCFYIGIKEDPEVRRKTRAKLGEQLKTFFDSTKFTKNRILSWPKLKDGMRVRVKVIAWKELPDTVFPEGRDLASVQRERIKEEEARAEAEAVAAVKAAKQSLSYVKGQGGATVTESAPAAAAGSASAAAAVASIATAPAELVPKVEPTGGVVTLKRPFDGSEDVAGGLNNQKKGVTAASSGLDPIIEQPISAPVVVHQTKKFKVSLKK